VRRDEQRESGAGFRREAADRLELGDLRAHRMNDPPPPASVPRLIAACAVSTTQNGMWNVWM
jgi:hypothetical protein